LKGRVLPGLFWPLLVKRHYKQELSRPSVSTTGSNCIKKVQRRGMVMKQVIVITGSVPSECISIRRMLDGLSPSRRCAPSGVDPGKPEVISSLVGLVPTNAPAVTNQSLEGSRLPITNRMVSDPMITNAVANPQQIPCRPDGLTRRLASAYRGQSPRHGHHARFRQWSSGTVLSIAKNR